MPRKTPVRELKAEVTAAPDSPIRRSSRIAAVVTTSTPTPAGAKVTTRRSSASETISQPARITRRLSLSHDAKEPESPMKSVGKSPTTLLKESNMKSTPAKLRARRGSKTAEEENSQPTTEQPADPPRRATRRSSISSTLEKISETDSPKPQKRLTRRRSSTTEPSQLDKITENEPEGKEKAANMETITENAEEPEVTANVAIAKKGDDSLDKKNHEEDDEVFKVDKGEKKSEKIVEGQDVPEVEKPKTNETLDEKDTSGTVKSPIIKVERLKIASLEKAKEDKLGDTDTNGIEEEAVEPTKAEDDSIEANCKKPVSSVKATELNGNKSPEKKIGNDDDDEEEIDNLELNITIDPKDKLDTSGNSDKENSNQLNISKTDTMQKLTEKVILNDQIAPSSSTAVLRVSHVQETVCSPSAKRKSLNKSPIREAIKSASPSFGDITEQQSDDEALAESPSKQGNNSKSVGNQVDQITSDVEDVLASKEDSLEKSNIEDIEESLPEVDVTKNSGKNAETESPEKIPFIPKASPDEDVDVVTVSSDEKLSEGQDKLNTDIADDDVIDDSSEEEEESKIEPVSKAKTPKKKIEESMQTSEYNKAETEENIITVDDDSQDNKKNEKSPKKNTSILEECETPKESDSVGIAISDEEDNKNSKDTPNKSSRFKTDDSKNKIKILDITPITAAITNEANVEDDSAIANDDITSNKQETSGKEEEMDEDNELNSTSISKEEKIRDEARAIDDEIVSSSSKKSNEDEPIDDNQDPPQKDKTTPQSRKSLNSQELAKSMEKNIKLLKSENDSENTSSTKTPVNNDEDNLEGSAKNDKKTPSIRRSLNMSILTDSSKKSRKSLIPEYDDSREDPTLKKCDVADNFEDLEPSQNDKKTPKKSRKSLRNQDLAGSSKKKTEGKRKSLKSEDDLIDSEIDETEMAEINEFLGEITSEEQSLLDTSRKSKKGRESISAIKENSLSSEQKDRRRSNVEDEFERYEKDDKLTEESTSAKKKKKPSMTVIETKDEPTDELDAQVSAYLKQKANEMFSSSTSEDGSEDDNDRPVNEFIDDMAEEVDEEESDVSVDSNHIECEGESLHSSDTESEAEEESYDDDSFICDDEDIELLSGNEDFLEAKSPKKKVSKKQTKSQKKEGQKFSRIVVTNDEDSETDTVEKSKKEDIAEIKKKCYSRILPKEVSESEDENSQAKTETNIAENIDEESNTKQEEIEISVQDVEEEANPTSKKSPIKSPVKIESPVFKVDSDSEDGSLSSTVKVDPNNSNVGNSSLLDSTTQGGRKSMKRSSISVQENISLQDINDGDLSQRITKVVEWFYTGIKSNADMSGNISLNVSLDYNDQKTEDQVKSSAKKRKSVGAIEVATEQVKSPCKKRKPIEGDEILSDSVFTSPSKKRKSIETIASTSQSPKKKSPVGKRSIRTIEVDDTSVDGPSASSKSSVESTNVIVVESDDETEKPPSAESTLEITVDRSERVVTRKQRKLKKQHSFDEVPFEGSDQLQSIAEFKQLKLDELDDWNKSDVIVKASTSEEPAKKRKRPQRKNILKPSVTMSGDTEWNTEALTECQASLAMPKVKRKKEFDAGSSKMPTFHPKDFKNQVIHSMGRVARMDTKILLRKRKV